MKVYERVGEYMRENGIDREEVALKAGIPEDVFDAILDGKRTMYADDLEAVCRALNVRPSKFIKYENL